MTRPIPLLAAALALTFPLAFHAGARHDETGSLTARFDSLLSAQFRSGEPGGAALVARNGRIVYRKAFGMANLELGVPMQAGNVFRIGSITKQFTAVAILRLAEQGRLGLQDDVTKYIPDYPTGGRSITIEHLLAHTSGIRDFARMRDSVPLGTLDFTPVEMIGRFKHEPLQFDPGTKWEYSNSGYVILGHVIERVTGTTYAGYLEDSIFRPLGMTRTSYASDTRIVVDRADGYTRAEGGFENAPYLSLTQPYAAGALQSTVGDLFLWHRALLSDTLIGRESRERAWTRTALTDGRRMKYGFGWRIGAIQGSPSVWHGGLINGFITMAMYLPSEDVFVAVFSNCDCNSPEDVTAKLAALAIGKPYEYVPIALDDTLLSRYAGVYENESGDQLIITHSGGRLHSQRGRGPKSGITPYREDGFFFDDDPMATLHFTLGPGGAVVRLTASNRDGEEAWLRTAKPLPPEDGIAVDAKVLSRYVGAYEISPEFSFTVTLEGGRLFVQGTDQEAIEMHAESETAFFLKANDARLSFVSDSSGTVTGATVRQGGRTADARKIR